MSVDTSDPQRSPPLHLDDIRRRLKYVKAAIDDTLGSSESVQELSSAPRTTERTRETATSTSNEVSVLRVAPTPLSSNSAPTQTGKAAGSGVAAATATGRWSSFSSTEERVRLEDLMDKRKAQDAIIDAMKKKTHLVASEPASFLNDARRSQSAQQLDSALPRPMSTENRTTRALNDMGSRNDGSGGGGDVFTAYAKQAVSHGSRTDAEPDSITNLRAYLREEREKEEATLTELRQRHEAHERALQERKIQQDAANRAAQMRVVLADKKPEMPPRNTMQSSSGPRAERVDSDILTRDLQSHILLNTSQEAVLDELRREQAQQQHVLEDLKERKRRLLRSKQDDLLAKEQQSLKELQDENQRIIQQGKQKKKSVIDPPIPVAAPMPSLTSSKMTSLRATPLYNSGNSATSLTDSDISSQTWGHHPQPHTTRGNRIHHSDYGQLSPSAVPPRPSVSSYLDGRLPSSFLRLNENDNDAEHQKDRNGYGQHHHHETHQRLAENPYKDYSMASIASTHAPPAALPTAPQSRNVSPPRTHASHSAAEQRPHRPAPRPAAPINRAIVTPPQKKKPNVTTEAHDRRIPSPSAHTPYRTADVSGERLYVSPSRSMWRYDDINVRGGGGGWEDDDPTVIVSSPSISSASPATPETAVVPVHDEVPPRGSVHFKKSPHNTAPERPPVSSGPLPAPASTRRHSASSRHRDSSERRGSRRERSDSASWEGSNSTLPPSARRSRGDSTSSSSSGSGTDESEYSDDDRDTKSRRRHKKHHPSSSSRRSRASEKSRRRRNSSSASSTDADRTRNTYNNSMDDDRDVRHSAVQLLQQRGVHVHVQQTLHETAPARLTISSDFNCLLLHVQRYETVQKGEEQSGRRGMGSTTATPLRGTTPARQQQQQQQQTPMHRRSLSVPFNGGMTPQHIRSSSVGAPIFLQNTSRPIPQGMAPGGPYPTYIPVKRGNSVVFLALPPGQVPPPQQQQFAPGMFMQPPMGRTNNPGFIPGRGPMMVPHPQQLGPRGMLLSGPPPLYRSASARQVRVQSPLQQPRPAPVEKRLVREAHHFPLRDCCVLYPGGIFSYPYARRARSSRRSSLSSRSHHHHSLLSRAFLSSSRPDYPASDLVSGVVCGTSAAALLRQMNCTLFAEADAGGPHCVYFISAAGHNCHNINTAAASERFSNSPRRSSARTLFQQSEANKYGISASLLVMQFNNRYDLAVFLLALNGLQRVTPAPETPLHVRLFSTPSQELAIGRSRSRNGSAHRRSGRDDTVLSERSGGGGEGNTAQPPLRYGRVLWMIACQLVRSYLGQRKLFIITRQSDPSRDDDSTSSDSSDVERRSRHHSRSSRKSSRKGKGSHSKDRIAKRLDLISPSDKRNSSSSKRKSRVASHSSSSSLSSYQCWRSSQTPLFEDTKASAPPDDSDQLSIPVSSRKKHRHDDYSDDDHHRHHRTRASSSPSNKYSSVPLVPESHRSGGGGRSALPRDGRRGNSHSSQDQEDDVSANRSSSRHKSSKKKKDKKKKHGKHTSESDREASTSPHKHRSSSLASIFKLSRFGLPFKKSKRSATPTGRYSDPDERAGGTSRTATPQMNDDERDRRSSLASNNNHNIYKRNHGLSASAGGTGSSRFATPH